jgi:dTDP-4-dehydrorhamnose reductase
MKILLIGKNGQLGWELQRTCTTLGEVIALDYPVVDLSHLSELRDLIKSIKPNLTINAAAYTDVDKAESKSELARTVNALAPAVMAEEMMKLKGALIHYSTDYVFDGTKFSPYIETDIPQPINVYGATKLEGEKLVQEVGGSTIILRTSWIYSLIRMGFIIRVLQWSHKEEVLKIVDDQISNPTWARMLAEITSQMIAQGKRDPIGYISGNIGLYHICGKGYTSRYAWAQEILKLDPKQAEQKVKRVLPVSTTYFPSPAQRPNYSALDCQKFSKNFDLVIPNWEVSLSLAMNTPIPLSYVDTYSFEGSI